MKSEVKERERERDNFVHPPLTPQEAAIFEAGPCRIWKTGTPSGSSMWVWMNQVLGPSSTFRDTVAWSQIRSGVSWTQSGRRWCAESNLMCYATMYASTFNSWNLINVHPLGVQCGCHPGSLLS